MKRAHPLRLPGPTAGLAIGIVGGSFDPPHSGHRHLIDIALKAGLDQVWVIPTIGNPLKAKGAPYATRVAAAREVLARPRVVISDIEAQVGAPFTIDLVRALRHVAPNARFVLVVGADSLASFHRWRSWRELAGTIPLLVVSRPGASLKARLSPYAQRFWNRRADANRLKNMPAPAWAFVAARYDPISSTVLRALSAQTPMPPV